MSARIYLPKAVESSGTFQMIMNIDGYSKVNMYFPAHIYQHTEQQLMTSYVTVIEIDKMLFIECSRKPFNKDTIFSLQKFLEKPFNIQCLN